MKIFTIFQTICLSYISANVSAMGQSITNDVALPQNAIHLSLTTADLETNFTLPALLANKDISADQQLHWVLQNTTTNRSGIVFLGMSNSFDFKLLGSNGKEIPKTQLGQSMSKGPVSLTSAGANPHVRDEGYAPGQVAVRDFPKLADLFNIPAEGGYILELRYWTWVAAKHEFVLSDPVRLRVIKKSASQ